MKKKPLVKQVLLGCAISAALLAAIYLTLLFIHRDDPGPSPAAASLASVLQQRPAVAAADNAYIYLMGIDSPAGTDPRATGATRIAALEAAARTHSFVASAGAMPAHRTLRSDAVEAAASACGQSASLCAAALEKAPAAAAAWAEAERWLHARYLVLSAHPQWRASAAMFEVDAPLPPLALAADGQTLLFIDAWQRAGKGDAAGVRALLDADLRFWRQVFAASDTMLMKAVAGTALRRHFALGDMALRRLPVQHQADAIPDQWRAPLSIAEKSLRAPLAGEMASLELILRHRVAGNDNAAGKRDLPALLRPAYKLQASLNQQAGKLLAQADAFDVDYKDVPKAVEAEARRAAAPGKAAGTGRSSTSNVVLASGGMSNPVPHALSAADVEGVRRVHLLAAELRSAGVAPDAIGAAIAAAALTDPYTGASFRWDETKRAIVFHGLEPGGRGVRAVPL